MLSDKTIVFIGSGVMAEAMITGLLRKEVTSAKNIIASGPRQERGERTGEHDTAHELAPFRPGTAPYRDGSRR